ncbi:MAG: hypothetical protein Q7T46_05210 [Polaromonas sp.]|nr:hypothetical protein [Polaromonas sp.]
MQNPTGEVTRQVRINGEAFQVTQLTEGTWTLTAASGQQTLPRDGMARPAMIEAIEGVSGCKVTDSDYSQAGRQLDAQVDCAGRLKN